eukprot:10783093-Alexandrium_andersonii.AAC.1
MRSHPHFQLKSGPNAGSHDAAAPTAPEESTAVCTAGFRAPGLVGIGYQRMRVEPRNSVANEAA